MSASISPVIRIAMDATETASEWKGLNSRYSSRDIHAFMGTLTTGDSITLEVCMDINPNKDPVEVSISSETFTDTVFQGTFNGGLRWIRAVKTGTAGPAIIKVEG